MKNYETYDINFGNGVSSKIIYLDTSDGEKELSQIEEKIKNGDELQEKEEQALGLIFPFIEDDKKTSKIIERVAKITNEIKTLDDETLDHLKLSQFFVLTRFLNDEERILEIAPYILKNSKSFDEFKDCKFEESIKWGKIEIAMKMKKNSYGDEEILKLTGIKIADIEVVENEEVDILDIIYKETIDKGVEKGKQEVAITMKKNNYDCDEISKITGNNLE